MRESKWPREDEQTPSAWARMEANRLEPGDVGLAWESRPAACNDVGPELVWASYVIGLLGPKI